MSMHRGSHKKLVIQLFAALFAALTTCLFSVVMYFLRQGFDNRCILYANWSNNEFFGDSWMCTGIAYGGFVVAGMGGLYFLHAVCTRLTSIGDGRDSVVGERQSLW